MRFVTNIVSHDGIELPKERLIKPNKAWISQRHNSCKHQQCKTNDLIFLLVFKVIHSMFKYGIYSGRSNLCTGRIVLKGQQHVSTFLVAFSPGIECLMVPRVQLDCLSVVYYRHSDIILLLVNLSPVDMEDNDCMTQKKSNSILFYI